MTTRKKDLGQYFTISEELQTFVFDKVRNRGALLLEPSFGVGHLLKKFKEADTDYPIMCYELDTTLKPIIVFNQHQIPVYGDFLQQQITQRFKTIVGNPPFVKKQKSKNLYIQFVEKCYDVLDDRGEIIFIVPSDFLKLTSASVILQKMSQTGSFTDFLFPRNEKLFENASIDVVVFRYEKGLIQKTTNVNGKTMFWNVKEGILTIHTIEQTGVPLNTLFDAFVGIVSGRDEVFKVPFGNISVLCDKEKIEQFIYTTVFPTQNEQINAHFLTHKDELMARKIRSFTEENWFEWGALRNLSSVQKYWGKPCIYVRNMTRKKEVAFLGTVQYFGGTLLCLIPKSVQTDLSQIVQYFNSALFQADYLYAGRFKIGQKQISNTFIPIMQENPR